MVRSGPLESNQHANKWCCASDTLSEVRRFKIHSELENI